MRTRILYVTDQLQIGGAEKQLIEICKGLDQEQFEVFLFCAIDGGELLESFAGHCTEVFVHQRKSFFDLAGMRKLARVIRDYRIEIVHSWLWYANIFCYLTTRIARAPHWLMSIRGIPLGFTRAHAFVEGRASKAVERITAVSEFNARHLREMHNVPEKKITVIYNGISVNETGNGKRTDLAAMVAGARPILGCIANFGREKGHRYLVEAMPGILAMQPQALLLLVGDGGLRSEVEEQVAAFGLSERVLFLGSRSDVPALLDFFDLLILPSLLEGTPNVVLEAMVAKVPVVATSAGGTTEVVDDQTTGLLVAPRDSAALTGAVLAMLADEDRARQMVAAGAMRAQTRFGMKRMVEEYEQLYAGILAGVKR
jgi:glycosyltransferase involved in cell wall biosynthesis